MLHHCVNRKSRLDRKFLWLGAQASQGVPMSDIWMHEARDMDDYKTEQAVCEAAKPEFPEFFGHHLNQWHRHIGFGQLICSWSVMRMWREIEQGDATAVAWLDDYALHVPVLKLERLVSGLSPDILLLAWHRRDDMFDRNEYHLPVRYKVPNPLRIVRTFPEVFVGTQGGADWANVLSPRGAGWLLQFMADRPVFNTEVAIPAFYFETRRKGVYAVRGNNPYEHGQVPMLQNRWVVDLSPYTDGAVSDLVGLHQGKIGRAEND